MSFLSRLFGTEPDPREEWRPLWHAVIGEARDPDWYRMCGVADTPEGRFDMITLVLSLVFLRLEREADAAPISARMTELFVEDMEGQLREAGIGDPTVGKKIGNYVESLGGRLSAYRGCIKDGDRAALGTALRRNVTMSQDDAAEALAERMMAVHDRLDALPLETLREGKLR